jgi:hypothetical protein
MARYGRTGYHITRSVEYTGEFAQNGDGTTGPERANYTAWCGEKSRGFRNSNPVYFRDYHGTDVCPKCSSKYWADKLAQRREDGTVYPFRLGDRLDLTPPSDYRQPMPMGVDRYYWKSLYPVLQTNVLVDDEEEKIVGFIGIESGWGKKWEIRAWERALTQGEHETGVVSMTVNGSIAQKFLETLKPLPSGERIKTDAKGYPSKEAALAEIEKLLDDGHLMTYRAVKVDKARRIEIAREEKAQRERDREEHAARMEARRKEKESARAALLSDIREALSNDNTSNFAHDVIWRTAREAGFTEEELYGTSPAPLAEAAPSSEPVTDEWGQIIG